MPPAVSDRRQQIQDARQRGLMQGQLDASVGVDPWLLASWERCMAWGHRPSDRVDFEPISLGDVSARTQANQPLIHAARPVVSQLLDTLSDTRYFAVVTDSAGIVIDAHGPSIGRDRRARDIARLGVDLSEQAVGTTAIAGALRERRPVWLHQGEHYFQHNTVYSCAGAPLIGPSGDCLGMLDLTGVEVRERPELKHLVARAALQIENAMARQTPHQLLVRLNWLGERLGHDNDGLLTLDGDGTLVGANSTARELLGHTLRGSDGSPIHAQDVLAVPYAHLFDLAATPGPHSIPTWNGLHLSVACSRPDHPTHHAPTTRTPLRKLEDAVIRQAVQEAKGNVTLAAQRLGIGRATVYRRLQAAQR